MSTPKTSMENELDFSQSGYQDMILSRPDLANCRRVWELILRNQTPPFLEIHRHQSMDYPTCAAWFGAALFKELGKECPHARRMFERKGPGGRLTDTGNKRLTRMISKCLFQLELISNTYSDYETSTGISGPSPLSTPDFTELSYECPFSGKSGHTSPTSAAESFTPRSSFSLHRSSFTSAKSDSSARSESSVSVSFDVTTSQHMEKFSSMMKGIAKSHAAMGVRMEDFFKFGTAFSRALHTICGDEVFTEAVGKSWDRMYSVMLRFIMAEYAAPIQEEAREDSSPENTILCVAASSKCKRPRSVTF